MLDGKSPAEVASLAWLKQGSGVRTVSRDSNNGRIGLFDRRKKRYD
jgi:hypothetical protein